MIYLRLCGKMNDLTFRGRLKIGKKSWKYSTRVGKINQGEPENNI